MFATDDHATRVALIDEQAIGAHLRGRTCVKRTTCGRFAVVNSTPRADGSLRLIRLFAEALHARRYNFAIHGESLGE